MSGGLAAASWKGRTGFWIMVAAAISLAMLAAPSLTVSASSDLGLPSTAPALPLAAPSHGGVDAQGAIPGVTSAHFMPMLRPGASPTGATPDATLACPAAPCTLSYNGGAVMHNPEVVMLYWEPSGYNFDNNDTMSVNPSDAQYASTQLGFFLNATKSAWMRVAQQYTDGSGAPGSTVSVWGTIWDRNAFPCGACNTVSSPLTDAQVQSEVQAMQSAHAGPTGTNVEYFVFTPLGIMECFSAPASAGNCDVSSATPYNDMGYCAYHSNVAIGGTTTLYAMMPDAGDHLAWCSAWFDTVAPYGPNGDQYGDWEISIDSHEFMESITDPVNGGGWTTTSGSEIGDVCAWHFAPKNASNDLTNLLMDPRPYFTQPEWSDALNACWQPDIPAPPTLGTIAVKAPSTVSSGTAYIWVNETVTSHPAGWGNLTVDFPANPAPGTIQVLSSTFPTTPSVVAASTPVAGCYSTCKVTTTYPMVLGKTSSWAAGTTYGMELAYTPGTSGAQNFYVKATVGDPGSAFASEWMPHSATTTDQQRENVTSYSITFSGTSSGPSVGTPSGSPPSVDVGQPVSFSASVTGGTYPYSYAWTTNPSTGLGCAATTQSMLNCTPTSSSIYTVTLTVTDSGGHVGSATSAGYTVYPTPTIAVPTANVSTVLVGGSVGFTTALGLAGSGTDTYSWTPSASGLGCPASTALTLTCSPSAAGSYTVSAKVTDSNLGTGTNVSAAVTVTSASNPAVTAPAGSPKSADVGQPVTFSTTPSGGSGTYSSFTWTVSPSSGLGCTSLTTTTASLSCTPSAASSYTLSVSVTDSAGHTGSSTPSTYVVSSDPAVAAPLSNKSSGSVDVSQAVTFSSTLTQPGAGSDSYSWSYSPVTGLGCPTSTSLSVSCTPTTAATYSLTLKVTDGNGGSGSATLSSFQVYVDPSLNAPTPSPSTVQTYQTVTFTATVANPGSGGDSYAWSSSPGNGLGCSWANALSVSCTPTVAGAYTVSTRITDSNGGESSASSTSFTVTAISGPLSASASVSPTTGPTSTVFTFSGSGSGGTPPYSYAWNFGDGTTGSGAGPQHTYSVVGHYLVTLTVSDSSSHTASKSLNISVTSSGTGGISANLVASPNPAQVGQLVSFTSSVSGGTPQYSYAWIFGDGHTSSLADPTHTYNATGMYTVALFVNDSAGHSFETSVVVAVQSAPSGGSGGLGTMGGIPLWVLLLLLALVVVIVVAVLAAGRRRRSSELSGPPSEGPSMTEGYAPMPFGTMAAGGGAVVAGAAVLPPSADEMYTATDAGAPPSPAPSPAPAPGPAPAPAPPLANAPSTDTVAPSPTPAAAPAAPPPRSPPPPPPPRAPPPPPSPATPAAKKPAPPTDRPIDEIAPDPFGGGGRR